MYFCVPEVVELIGEVGLLILSIFLCQVEEVLVIDYGDRRYFDYLCLEGVEQQILGGTGSTLSSARSLGRKRVTCLLRM